MNSKEFLFHKPKSFLTAGKLIVATIFIGLLGFVMRDYNIGISNNGGIFAIALTVLGYVLIWLLLKQMSLCKKWARTILLVFYLLIFISFIGFFMSSYVISLIEIALLTLQATLMLLTLVFLYKQECNVWFNNSRSEMLP